MVFSVLKIEFYYDLNTVIMVRLANLTNYIAEVKQSLPLAVDDVTGKFQLVPWLVENGAT